MARLPPSYDDNVFLNCPFTEDYRDLFLALVFTVADCGFVARSALEKSDSSETRIDKLYRIIGECRYGIHDISMTELDPKNNLPRFNMPLELGIFLGARRFGSPAQRNKACLILDREKHRYQTFCSDLSGQDPMSHRGASADVVKCVRDWLRGERPGVRLPGSERTRERFKRFKDTDMTIICDGWDLDPDELVFNDLATVIQEWLRRNPL